MKKKYVADLIRRDKERHERRAGNCPGQTEERMIIEETPGKGEKMSELKGLPRKGTRSI
jgi:hypothetical protein